MVTFSKAGMFLPREPAGSYHAQGMVFCSVLFLVTKRIHSSIAEEERELRKEGEECNKEEKENIGEETKTEHKRKRKVIGNKVGE
jgi:hypothetical protein